MKIKLVFRVTGRPLVNLTWLNLRRLMISTFFESTATGNFRANLSVTVAHADSESGGPVTRPGAGAARGP